MKAVYVFSLLLFFKTTVHAQSKLYCKEAKISFFSKTAMENITAQNNKALCVWDTASGQFEFSVLIKGFEFDKALMQEHFNENYLESSKFPKASFKGQIDNYTKIDVSKNGKSTVKVSGDLTLHGITKKLTTDAVIEVKDGKIDADATFNIKVADFNIAIPSLVNDKIAKSVKVKVDATLDVLK